MSGGASATAIFVEDRDAGSVGRLDPRFRLAAALLFLFTLVFLQSAASLAVALGVGVAAAIWARPPLRSTLRRLAEIEGFLGLLLVSLPFTVAGREVFSLLGYPASVEGFQRAVTIMVRVNAAVLVITALVSTMGTTRLAGAMTGIGVPSKLANLFQLTVRYVSVFHEEFARLRRAMKARAFAAGSNRHSWRTLGNLLGMLLVRSIERAERVSRAMKCRGYSGRFPSFEERAIDRADIAFALITGAILAGLIAIEATA